MLRGFRSGAIVLLTGLLVLSPIAVVFSPSLASAAQDNPSDQLERWFYYRGMRACLGDPDFAPNTPADDNGDRSSSQINEGHILPNDATGGGQPKKGFGYLAPDMDGGDDNDGTVNCGDGSIFVRGATLFGFDNAVGLICAMNKALSGGDNGRIEPSHPTDCEQSTKFHFDGGGGSVFQRALTKALEDSGSKDRPAFQINDNSGPDYTYKALLYLIGKRSLEVFCGNNASLETGSANGGNIDSPEVVSVDIVSSDGTIKPSQPYALADPDRDENSKVDDVYYNQGGSDNDAKDLRCHEMATMTRDNATAYADWAALHGDEAEENENGTGSEDDSGSGDGDETTCAIDGIGWIVCPVMTFTANIIDKAYQQVASWLNVTPIITTGGGSAMYSAWVAMRDIANVAFVIAFMIIIYSQITSMGVSNYGIKKLLPKIVVAAVLVNMSYILCAIMVDISNIAGSSLYSLLHANSFTQGIDTSHFEGDAASTDGGWVGIVGAILASSEIIYLALPALIVALPAALLAIVTVFLVLALRQVLIILLIVISPLAFVALLLPNTEDWFKRWRKLFVSLLMMYPIIALLFGASALASTVVMNSATDVNGDGKISLQLMGALITILPLALTPIIMKGSAGVLNRFAGIVNNPNRGPFDALRKRAEGVAGNIRGNRDARAMERATIGSRVLGRGRRSRIQREAKYAATEARVKEATSAFKNSDGKASKYDQRAIQSNINASKQEAISKAVAEQGQIKDNLELNVKAKVNELELGAAKAQEDRLFKEMATKEGLTSVLSEGVNYNMAQRARVATDEAHIEGLAANSADIKKRSEQVKELVDSGDPTALAVRAAGITGQQGALRVASGAKAAVSKEIFETIDHIENTMDFDLASNPEALHAAFTNAAEAGNIEEQVAYMKKMMQNGAPGVQQARQALIEYTNKWPQDSERAMDLKEFLGSDPAFKKAGRSFEVWSNNEMTDVTDANGKTVYKTDASGNILKDANDKPIPEKRRWVNFEEVSQSTSVYAPISGQRFASMAPDEQMHALKLLEAKAPADLAALATRIAADETAMGNIKGPPQDFIARILKAKADQDEAAATYGPTI